MKKILIAMGLLLSLTTPVFSESSFKQNDVIITQHRYTELNEMGKTIAYAYCRRFRELNQRLYSQYPRITESEYDEVLSDFTDRFQQITVEFLIENDYTEDEILLIMNEIVPPLLKRIDDYQLRCDDVL